MPSQLFLPSVAQIIADISHPFDIAFWETAVSLITARNSTLQSHSLCVHLETYIRATVAREMRDETRNAAYVKGGGCVLRARDFERMKSTENDCELKALAAVCQCALSVCV